ncbi:hypothetical protein [Glycomyces tenuis]|uniref:hypothetical protein n=1 Tax=Glycomyces tenuis TaxID=58116 RepID=UPI0004211C51|nr:hypothetical protein [Glycomyces tenuis]
METRAHTERVCVTCPALGRDGEHDRPQPNLYDYRHSCGECRAQLPGILKRIPLNHAELDPTPGSTKGEHVTGTMDAPLGVRVAVLDELSTGPAIALASPPIPIGPDQEGTLPAVRVLGHIAHAWLPAWQEAHPDEHLPAATVEDLADWLAKRVDWALNTLPALMPDHAAYLRALDHRLDRLNGSGTNKPTIIDGVACRECDRYSLIRQGDDVICTAKGCRCRMSPAEYERWTKLSAAHAQQDHQKAA